VKVSLVGLLALLAACPVPPIGDDGASRSAPDPDLECLRDQDCALLPHATCCGECPPAPPFEVGTREDLDAIFITLESECALDRRECAPLECAPIPAGCTARAACDQGRCVVEEDGCGLPQI
jgi:hypothetical protein